MKGIIKDRLMFRLTIQITVISITLIAASFFTDTEIWEEYFTFKAKPEQCNYGPHQIGVDYGEHYHWNYRGWVYFLTGLTYFILSVIRIVRFHTDKEYEIHTYSVEDSIKKDILELESQRHLWSEDRARLDELRGQLIDLQKRVENGN